MFYPVNSLRKGGRFYLLWMADSYPTRFASVVNRQLWAQDTRKLCDELLAIIISESGRPTHRYSLRLSSQLMRGLVRVYQKKVNGLLKEMCMYHANVTKHANKKYIIQEERQNVQERALVQARPQSRPRSSPQRRSTRTARQPGEEQRVEEILQNKNNAVANIQDITLREAVIPEIVMPNDGFGEEHPDQALQLLMERTVEEMLAQQDTTAQRSVLDLLAEEASHDKTRMANVDVEMELMPGHDVTLARPSVGVRTSLADFEKEIPEITDIQLLPIPEVAGPQEKQQQQAETEVPEAVQHPTEELRARDAVQEPTQIELEELEEFEPRRKRPRRLIIDKKTLISSGVIRARIQNPYVDCQKFFDTKFDAKVPMDVYMNRPCHAGVKERSYMAPTLTRRFLRHLGYIHRETSTDRETEEGAMQRRTIRPASHLEHIQEVEGLFIPEVPNNQQQERPQELTVEENLPPLEVEMSRDLWNVPEQQDISEMLTQQLRTFSQQEKERESSKRVSAEPAPTAKRFRHGDTQVAQRTSEAGRQSAVAEKEKHPSMAMDADKENVPSVQQMPRPRSSIPSDERRLTVILQEAGLGDIPVEPPQIPQTATGLADIPVEPPQIPQSANIPVEPPQNQEAANIPARSKLTQSSGSSETPLGSLDRTSVSLGDSGKTTESARFIKERWGTPSTMIRIFRCFQQRKEQEVINVKTLLAQGPILQEYKNIIMAKCFTSILKLKQAGFIKVIKCPETLEIKDIVPGSRLENYTF